MTPPSSRRSRSSNAHSRAASSATPSWNHRGSSRPPAARASSTCVTSWVSKAPSESCGYDSTRPGSSTTVSRSATAKPVIHRGVRCASGASSGTSSTWIGAPASSNPTSAVTPSHRCGDQRSSVAAPISAGGASISSRGFVAAEPVLLAAVASRTEPTIAEKRRVRRTGEC